MLTPEFYARFKDNIWAIDFPEIWSSSSKNWSVKYLLCEIVVFTKYAWVKQLKKKTKTVLCGFIEVLNKYKCKPSKLWVDKERVFSNNLMQKY